MRWGESVVVLGCGGVGVAAVQGARLAGAATIVAVDPVRQRREAALRCGATAAIDAEGSVSEILGRSEGGVDLALECVGSTATMADAFAALRPGGRAVVVGLPGLRDRLEIPAILLLQGEVDPGIDVRLGQPDGRLPAHLALADEGRLDLGALVGKTRPFLEVNEGIAETRTSDVTRVVVLTF